MNLELVIIIFLIGGLCLNFINYHLFLTNLAIIWYVVSIFIIYLAVKLTIKYKFRQFNLKKIFASLKSMSKNEITPLASLMVSLAGKIGVGSLSGVALAIYYGGIGTIFWLIVISLFISINTYREVLLGIKYRVKLGNSYYGGPSYYIKKCLGNKQLAKLYSFILIISYGMLFLSIQANTIVTVAMDYRIKTYYVIVILFMITFLIIIRGIKGIFMVNSKLVPLMLIIYVLFGFLVAIKNYYLLPGIFINMIKLAFNPRSIITVFLIGMQRSVFITESTIGTSAISASSCDNNPDKQGLLEVLGIYIIIFLICLTTFLIMTTANINNLNFININGIELLLVAFNYHFGSLGKILLSVITILFAFSTIISSYYFGLANLNIFSGSKKINLLYGILFMIVIIISGYIRPIILWNLTDYFIAILALINIYAIMKIEKRL